MYTKENLIERAKTAEEGILNCHLPMITEHYGDFADHIGLDLDALYSLPKYIKAVSYEAKRHVFESLGFKVRHLSLGAHKVSHLANDTKFGKSIDAAFLDRERNAFILDVEHGSDNLYFILEYDVDGDPLADHTVDREKLAKEQARKEEGRNLFRRMMKSASETKDDAGSLF